MKKDCVIFSLRMSKELHQILKDYAAEEQRSMNGMALVMIQDYLKRNGKLKAR